MVEGVGNAISQTLGCLGILFLMSVVMIIAFTSYLIYDKWGDEVVESKTIIKPDYRLETNGKEIDTTYIYTFK